ncbi:hypothetical protein MMC07_003699 [Pseudocyphellaria aurata]|nr:hypothetical protein [Pseudocyphellaria aurata]
MATSNAPAGRPLNLRYVPLLYNSAESDQSASRLIFTLFPEWEHAEGKLEFVRFTEGITNTLIKAVKRRPGYTEEQIDEEAVLLRAYGNGTEVLIDRDRETISHSLLSQLNLAPPLLARFQNGLLYRFIRGRVCKPEDLRRENVWRGVARRLGEWHARLPIVFESEEPHIPSASKLNISEPAINGNTSGKGIPNLWSVMQKWVLALPATTDQERTRKNVLQKELKRSVMELGGTLGLGKNGLVYGHCDLLCGNVIVHPQPSTTTPQSTTVSFIDYEYATPCPAAFDLANHFAEWGGLSCDYSVLPTRSVRRSFLREYLDSYTHHITQTSSPHVSTRLQNGEKGAARQAGERQEREEMRRKELEQRLFDEVDRFRGIPGLYWGVWALIQKTISQIDFDYGSYAELRLGEYWASRREEQDERNKRDTGHHTRENGVVNGHREVLERERRWATE